MNGDPIAVVPGAKTRYSDAELIEFRNIILKKLEIAKSDYDFYSGIINNTNGTEDTSPTFKVLEEGAITLSKEDVGKLINRLKEFIKRLEASLVRIENKTYGICRDTGILIPRERLIAVPHTTLCIEAKKN